MLFNRKRTPPIRSLIGEGTVLSGDLTFSDGLRIDGHVHGDVCCADGTPSIVVISDTTRDQVSSRRRYEIAHILARDASGVYPSEERRRTQAGAIPRLARPRRPRVDPHPPPDR